MHTRSEAIKPLKYMAYAAYVLVPYVGHRLIAEDLSCSSEEAFEVMVKSRRVGTILHPLDDTDPDIDEVIIINNRLARRDKERVSFLSSIVLVVLTTSTLSLGTRNRRRMKSGHPQPL